LYELPKLAVVLIWLRVNIKLCDIGGHTGRTHYRDWQQVCNDVATQQCYGRNWTARCRHLHWQRRYFFYYSWFLGCILLYWK